MGRFTVEGVKVDDLPWRPGIYEPMPGVWQPAPPCYGLAVPVSLVPPAIACWIATPRNEVAPTHFTAKSTKPPTVWQGSLKALVQALAELEAQNRPRNEFFIGKTLLVHLETFSVPDHVRERYYGGSPVCGLTVHGVEIMS